MSRRCRVGDDFDRWLLTPRYDRRDVLVFCVVFGLGAAFGSAIALAVAA